jgi:hypothetical protein
MPGLRPALNRRLRRKRVGDGSSATTTLVHVDLDLGHNESIPVVLAAAAMAAGSTTLITFDDAAIRKSPGRLDGNKNG